MTKADWYKLATEIQARWPNREIPEESVEIWFEDIADFPPDQVRAGILALYRDGREWCPNGAQIRAKVVELGRDDLSYGQAWELAKRAALKADPRVAAAWLGAQSPEALAAVKELTGGTGQLAYANADEATVRAQFRDIYRTVTARRTREAAYVGIQDGDLRALQQGKPTRIADALLRALPAGEVAA